jgi:hypothetical protein
MDSEPKQEGNLYALFYLKLKALFATTGFEV